jgi:hypothetical protein
MDARDHDVWTYVINDMYLNRENDLLVQSIKDAHRNKMCVYSVSVRAHTIFCVRTMIFFC